MIPVKQITIEIFEQLEIITVFTGLKHPTDDIPVEIKVTVPIGTGEFWIAQNFNDYDYDKIYHYKPAKQKNAKLSEFA